MANAVRETPASAAQAAALLRAAASERSAVRIVGSGTKLEWGSDGATPELEVSTRALDRLVDHDAGDLTVTVEAGARLADVQRLLGAEGQMLALDPPLGTGDGATIGGVLATGDSGPLRHRYGAARDLVLGMTVALSDGSVARSGGRVIKNVAGYDVAKLFTGSYGTLGAIVEVVLRLHPLPPATATLVGSSDDPAALARAALTLAHAPLELEALDVTWSDGRGSVLARFTGVTAAERAREAARDVPALAPAVLEDDARLWKTQRDAQRSDDAMVVRVAGLPGDLERVLRAATHLGGSVVGRAGLGVSWVRLPAASPGASAAALDDIRRELAPAACVVLDLPSGARERIDPWDARDPALVALMRRVRRSFDPAGVCNPGVRVA